MAESDLKFIEEAFRRGELERGEEVLRATAVELASSFDYGVSGQVNAIEAALTQVWNEAIEAAANLVDVIPLLPPGSQTAGAIRRLRKGNNK